MSVFQGFLAGIVPRNMRNQLNLLYIVFEISIEVFHAILLGS